MLWRQGGSASVIGLEIASLHRGIQTRNTDQLMKNLLGCIVPGSPAWFPRKKEPTRDGFSRKAELSSQRSKPIRSISEACQEWWGRSASWIHAGYFLKRGILLYARPGDKRRQHFHNDSFDPTMERDRDPATAQSGGRNLENREKSEKSPPW